MTDVPRGHCKFLESVLLHQQKYPNASRVSLPFLNGPEVLNRFIIDIETREGCGKETKCYGDSYRDGRHQQYSCDNGALDSVHH